MGNIYASYSVQPDISIISDKTFIEDNTGYLYRIDPSSGTITITLPVVTTGMWFDVFKVTTGTVIFEASGGATIRQTDLQVSNLFERIRIQMGIGNEWNIEGTLEAIPSIANTLPTGWWRYDIGVNPVPVNPWNQAVLGWANQGSVGGTAAPSGFQPRTDAEGISFSSKSQNLQQTAVSNFISVSGWTSASVIISQNMTINRTNTWENPGVITDMSGGWGTYCKYSGTTGPNGYSSFYAQAYFWDGASPHTVQVFVPDGNNNANTQQPFLLLSNYDSGTTNMTMAVYDLTSKGAGAVLIGTTTAATAVIHPASLAGNISVGNNSLMVDSTHQRSSLEVLTWPRVLSAGEMSTVVNETLNRWGGA